MVGRPRGTQGSELLDIARDAFVTAGFAGTTMDEIAARARISKSSLYRDHRSKDELYAAVVDDWVQRGRDAMRPLVVRLLATDDLPAGLLVFARALQDGILSAPVLRMRALVAAEAARFPEVSRRYVEESWHRNLELLADAFSEFDRRGALRLDDARAAARQFTWLCVADPLNEWTLTGDLAAVEPDRLTGIAENAVATFLSRYGGHD